ncbi:ABC transporter G family member 20-like isoform X2 [Pseudomyrmex gracilis]|nr:ABC transporter G family member 20-like isoform X2 [Pseudomyrmex gracilis]XP_020289832.1 ABC transporter G family member 20-like isoform X2 [Pseudomyrmex gracilis]XP_020289833.1 ABC transporter G family member 20-like isoform X2 [Pseudomyrmex gracilis]XP_020289834.1 ABC transporter G family member 20-like isoform X2 [Pseudomyrmex gracilis]
MVLEEAVVVRNAAKSYGKKVVLKGLNMTVSRASIYALLGASGCGKTTLLSCIVGVRHLDNGEVWVLGGTPGSKGSGIPGPRVGYMPQDISLTGEFTVSDALYYFGRINGLDNVEIEERQDFLTDLLQLPSANHLVKNMSGGQQRRVSFAAALIHRPELLILDEPTVGLDPVLRENLWTYLIKITQTEGTTVLITTHYIEEAKDANKIGLLREGELLTESSPQHLLNRFQTESLEEAFLTLSQMQTNRLTAVTHVNNAQVDDNNSNINKNISSEDKTSRYQRTRDQVSSLRRFKALMAKNIIQFFRYYSGLVFAVFFPLLQVSAFFIGVGGEPKGLKIGIVNDEAGNCDYGNDIGNIWYNEVNDIPECNWSNLSCRFIHNYKDTILEQEYYNDITEANAAVQKGKVSGVMHFGSNFSEALLSRLDVSLATVNTSEYLADITASQINIFLDMSDLHLGVIVKKTLMDHFFEIFQDVLTSCGYPEKYTNLPIRFENPIYGSNNYTSYKQFMAPVYLLTLAFFIATYVSSSLLITERAEGVWNRSLVQGVKTAEILLSHFLTQSVIICVHTAIIMCLSFPVWGLDCQGSLYIVTLFVFLMGLGGLMYGFFISVTCSNHTMAHYASAGSFWPLVLLTGGLWPVEGMPRGLRYISYILPTTLPSISMRQVMDKSKLIYEWEVFNGFLIIIGWILVLLMFSLISLKSHTKFS